MAHGAARLAPCKGGFRDLHAVAQYVFSDGKAARSRCRRAMPQQGVRALKRVAGGVGWLLASHGACRALLSWCQWPHLSLLAFVAFS